MSLRRYAAFSPFEEPNDQLLSNIAQCHTFFALAMKILIMAHPNSLFLDYLLSGLLFLPLLAALFLDTEIIHESAGLHKWLGLHKKDGSDSPWWACVWKSAYSVHRAFDRCIGSPRPNDEYVHVERHGVCDKVSSTTQLDDVSVQLKGVEEAAAATALQAVVRGRSGRKLVNVREAQEAAAATLMQAALYDWNVPSAYLAEECERFTL